MHACDNVQQTHELTHMIRYVNTHFHLWKFGTWRFVLGDLLYLCSGFPGRASGKEPSCQCRRHKRHWFEPWVGKIPPEKEMATHSSILAWTIPWTEEAGGLQSIESQSQTRLKQLSMHACTVSVLAYTRFQWMDITAPSFLWLGRRSMLVGKRVVTIHLSVLPFHGPRTGPHKGLECFSFRRIDVGTALELQS